MPLRNIRVLEFTGLAPSPFCGKLLADFGASVTRIDRIPYNPIDCFQDNKRTLVLDIKQKKAQNLLKILCKNYDVLIEPYRPGVMEKYNLGPEDLRAANPRLIYSRLTGFGQEGVLSRRAGHDINYVALSGVLSFLGRKNENPTVPINLLADFAGGGLLCAFGICLALLERTKSGKGQVVDNSMVEGCAYIGSWLMKSQELPLWTRPRGENQLDSGSFYYDTYKTKDGKFMSVGALEPQFYDEFVKGLGLSDIKQSDDNEQSKKIVSDAFLKKTQKEWSDIFEKVDACVFPVLDWREAGEHEHNRHRKTFVDVGGKVEILPNPAPKLSRTPGKLSLDLTEKNRYAETLEILGEIGFSETEVLDLAAENVIVLENKSKL